MRQSGRRRDCACSGPCVSTGCSGGQQLAAQTVNHNGVERLPEFESSYRSGYNGEIENLEVIQLVVREGAEGCKSSAVREENSTDR